MIHCHRVEPQIPVYQSSVKDLSILLKCNVCCDGQSFQETLSAILEAKHRGTSGDFWCLCLRWVCISFENVYFVAFLCHFSVYVLLCARLVCWQIVF